MPAPAFQLTDLSAVDPATLAANWIVPLAATIGELADTVTEVTAGIGGEPPGEAAMLLEVFGTLPQPAMHRAAATGVKQNRSNKPRSWREAFIYPKLSLRISFVISM